MGDVIFYIADDMQYTFLVADDNLIECDAVVLVLRQLYPEAHIITCSDGLEVIAALRSNRVDVVFSDIEMPGLDGFGLIKSLSEPPPFVFITSYADYAVESFAVDAIDFIVKPVSFARVAKSARKVLDYVALRGAMRQSANSTNHELITDETLDGKHFFIRENGGITRIFYADVAYVESMGDFSRIYKGNGEDHIVLSGLKSLETQLPDKLFVRVHRQYLVNLQHLQSIGRAEVLLKNKARIPLGAAFQEQVTAAFVNKEPLKRY